MESIIHNSTENLSFRVADFGNVYILPPICLFGLITNFFSILVLSRPELKGIMYQFMLINTIADFTHLLLGIFLIFVRCGSLCSTSFTFIAKFYELYIFLFISNNCLLFIILLDIVLSIDRLLSFTSKPSVFKNISLKKKCIWVLIVTIFINSVVYLIPRMVSNIGYLRIGTDNITDYQYSSIYVVGNNEIGKNEYMALVLKIINIVRGFILLVILFFINSFVVVKFRKHFEKKKKISLYSVKCKKN